MATIKGINWDSKKPEKLFGSDGRAIGVLMPRFDKLEAENEPHTAEVFNIADYRKKSNA